MGSMASSACQLEGRTPSPGRPSEAGGTMPWRVTMPRGSWAAWAAWMALAGRVGAPTPWAFRDAGRADGWGPKGRCLSNRLVRGRKWREGGRHYGAGEVARGTRKREAAGREGERVAWERAAHLQGVDKGCRPRATRRVPRKRAAPSHSPPTASALEQLPTAPGERAGAPVTPGVISEYKRSFCSNSLGEPNMTTCVSSMIPNGEYADASR